MKTSILHLLKGVFTKHINGSDEESSVSIIGYDYNDSLYDNYPEYDEEKYGPIGNGIWNTSLLVYPQYCMAYIEWYFGSMLESLNRDMDSKVPLTIQHIRNCDAHLRRREDGGKWPKAIYEASDVIYQKLYEYALQDGTVIDSSMSFDDFMKRIRSEEFAKGTGYFGNQFG